MKKIFLLAAIVLFTGTAFAGSYPIVEKTIKGDNDSCPMLLETGIAHIWNKGDKAEVKTTLSYTNSINGITADNSVKITNILEF